MNAGGRRVSKTLMLVWSNSDLPLIPFRFNLEQTSGQPCFSSDTTISPEMNHKTLSIAPFYHQTASKSSKFETLAKMEFGRRHSGSGRPRVVMSNMLCAPFLSPQKQTVCLDRFLSPCVQQCQIFI